MKKGVPRIYYLIPFLYIALSSAFLYLHFTRTESHIEQIGYLTLSVESKHGSNRDRTEIQRISVYMNGFAVNIGNDTPVWLYDNTIPFKAEIVGYRTFPDGLEITFTGNLQLRFLSGSNGSPQFSIIPVLTGTENGFTSARIPIEYPNDTVVSVMENLPVTAFAVPGSTGAVTFFLTLPKQGRYDKTGNDIIIPGQIPKGFEITYEKAPEGITDPFVYWYSHARKTLSGRDYETAVTGFTGKAVAGWSDERFRSGLGGWTTREGKVEYQETLAAAYLSESLARNSYQKAQTQIRGALSIRGGRPGFLSAPYLGNLRGAVEIQQEEDIERLEKITGLLKRRDPSLFTEEGIIQFIVDRGPYSLIKDLRALAESVYAGNGERSVRIGLFSAYLDGLMIDPEIGTGLSFAESIPHTDIFPSIVTAGSGLYLLGTDGTVSVRDSIKVGTLLMKMADIRETYLYREIGRDLIVSALALADGTGYVPRTLTIQEGRITKKTGQIAPEEIYPLVARNANYPHQVSLYSSLAPGSWIWTAGKISYMKMEKDEYRIGIQYPADGIHHIIFQGIKPFQALKLYGIPWKSDTAFEAYSAGWIYIRETETLLIKLRHRTEEEEIVIVFGRMMEEEEQSQEPAFFQPTQPAQPRTGPSSSRPTAATSTGTTGGGTTGTTGTTSPGTTSTGTPETGTIPDATTTGTGDSTPTTTTTTESTDQTTTELQPEAAAPDDPATTTTTPTVPTTRRRSLQGAQ